ncbi:MAG TPA: PhzF family phenazine biosynthesis protein [Thermoanaerobaculia bacterium]|nr:PhzF family phenazine biosynthesis protein [Thermoanaerobaculia bacterium]
MKISFVTCDVFTDRPFAGNPLLVVPDARGMTTAGMQAVAREINYSESTFVLPPADPAHAYLQRTFVPVKEIPYAGHPTVGTAVVMASLGKVAPGTADGTTKITIEVGFGPLALELERSEGRVSRVRMEQGRPEWRPPVTGDDVKGKLAAALGVPFDALHRDLPAQTVSTGNAFLLAPLASVEAVSSALADPRMLNVVEKELGVLGVYFFAFAPEGRMRARLFAPGAGVPEDPATGSAAGPLAVYLSLHGAVPGGVGGGSGRFVIDQGIEMGRPSVIEAEVLVDAADRPVGVRVAGRAVLMMEGTLEV